MRAGRGHCGRIGCLATAALATALLQHLFLWSGTGGGGGGSCPADGAAWKVASSPLPPQLLSDEWDAPGCSPPAINESSLGFHNCAVRNDVCIDQRRFISLAPEGVPGSANFSRAASSWRFDNAPTAVPGHFDGLHGPFEIQYCQPLPSWRPAALEREQPDISTPRFSRCTMPVVFYPYWHMNAYEFFISTLEPLWRMTPGAGVAPLLLDRRAKLTPVIDGYGLPAFYHWLLAPFSDRPVEELSDLSARRHAADARRSRCFRRILFCSVRNDISPPPGIIGNDYRVTHKPAAVGQTIVQFYRKQLPTRFRRKPPKDVLEVLVIARPYGSRRMLNLDQLLALCNSWTPAVGGFKRARCRIISFENGGFLDDLASLQRSHILLGLHGAPLMYGFLMRPGAAVVEIRPHGFTGHWPNHYSQMLYNNEKIIRFFYMHTSELNWQPGEWERRGIANGGRDRNTIVDWTMLSKVLTDAAAGGPGYNASMTAEEAPHFQEEDD